MAFYELVFLVRQDASTQNLAQITDKVKEIINSDNGAITREENWGLRTLAYPIQNNRKAHYICINFSGNGKMVDEISRQLRINENVLRSMTIKTATAETEPSIMMQKYDDRKLRHFEDDLESGEE